MRVFQWKDSSYIWQQWLAVSKWFSLHAKVHKYSCKSRQKVKHGTSSSFNVHLNQYGIESSIETCSKLFIPRSHFPRQTLLYLQPILIPAILVCESNREKCTGTSKSVVRRFVDSNATMFHPTRIRTTRRFNMHHSFQISTDRQCPEQKPSHWRKVLQVMSASVASTGPTSQSRK